MSEDDAVDVDESAEFDENVEVGEDAAIDETPDVEVGDGSGAEADEAEGADGGDGADDRTDVAAPSGDADLVDRVEAHDADLAEEVAELQARVERLETKLTERSEEVDEITSRLKRKQADFQNYKRRAKHREEQIRERATEDLIERIVPVRDNLLRALDQEEGADIRPGVESTLEEFDSVLEAENVEPIDPDPGDEVDPTRHQVMLRVESDEAEGTVDEVYQPGYEMGEKVIREAQVTVSDGNENGDGDGE